MHLFRVRAGLIQRSPPQETRSAKAARTAAMIRSVFERKRFIIYRIPIGRSEFGSAGPAAGRVRRPCSDEYHAHDN
jgi:hypothetical protein